jgi:hypothetical protein
MIMRRPPSRTATRGNLAEGTPNAQVTAAEVKEQAKMSSRTFIVGVWVGRRIVSWPFGRLDINDDSLGVRSRPAFQLRGREAVKGSVQTISIKRRSGTTLLKIRDSGDAFSSVIVQMPLGSAKIVDELRRRGYPVTDER